MKKIIKVTTPIIMVVPLLQVISCGGWSADKSVSAHEKELAFNTRVFNDYEDISITKDGEEYPELVSDFNLECDVYLAFYSIEMLQNNETKFKSYGKSNSDGYTSAWSTYAIKQGSKIWDVNKHFTVDNGEISKGEYLVKTDLIENEHSGYDINMARYDMYYYSEAKGTSYKWVDYSKIQMKQDATTSMYKSVIKRSWTEEEDGKKLPTVNSYILAIGQYDFANNIFISKIYDTGNPISNDRGVVIDMNTFTSLVWENYGFDLDMTHSTSSDSEEEIKASLIQKYNNAFINETFYDEYSELLISNPRNIEKNVDEIIGNITKWNFSDYLDKIGKAAKK